MTASGRVSRNTRATSSSRVMSRSFRVIAETTPTPDRRSTTAEPSCPDAPVIKKRIMPRRTLARASDYDTIAQRAKDARHRGGCSLKMELVDTLIVGGGVTGLATAYELANRGLAVVLAERHGRFGQE